jgi:hypothetical protein
MNNIKNQPIHLLAVDKYCKKCQNSGRNHLAHGHTQKYCSYMFYNREGGQQQCADYAKKHFSSKFGVHSTSTQNHKTKTQKQKEKAQQSKTKRKQKQKNFHVRAMETHNQSAAEERREAYLEQQSRELTHDSEYDDNDNENA